jgi:hypothetical protein
LIQHERVGVVIRSNDEMTPPQVRPPMPHCLHQPNEFPFIRGEFEVACGERATEESEGAVTLVQHRPKPRAGSIAVHREVLGEVGELQYRRRG